MDRIDRLESYRVPADRMTVEQIAERLNCLIHGVGFLFSVPAFILLVSLAEARGDVGHLVSCTVYGGALVFMYAASLLYHGVPASPLKDLLRVVDHIAIYFLIAGTYTPFMLVHVGGSWGWTMLFIVWGMALAGILFKVFYTGRFMLLSTGLYLLMGWMLILVSEPLLAALPMEGILWVLAGGIFYTGGVIFFLWESFPYSHPIWHLFVIAGSACHYIAVLLYVIP
jgi:hemolysin III